MWEKSIERLIEEIEKSNYCESPEDVNCQVYDNLENNKVLKDDSFIVFIGDDKYPSKKKSTYSINVSSFGMYTKYGFNCVAFLGSQKTLELYSIVGILMGSMDDAASLIEKLYARNLMNNFAKYLLYTKHVILVNANGQINEINSLLKNYKNHKVFLCCGKKYTLKSFTTMNKTRTNRKRNFIFIANHPSSKSYISSCSKTCSTYLSRKYFDSASNLTIGDFKVF